VKLFLCYDHGFVLNCNSVKSSKYLEQKEVLIAFRNRLYSDIHCQYT